MLHVQRQAGVLVSNGTELTPSESLFTSDDEQVKVHVLSCVIPQPDVPSDFLCKVDFRNLLLSSLRFAVALIVLFLLYVHPTA